MADFIVFDCPHCGATIAVAPNELNCKIFRCGEYKSTKTPIPPHASKEDCDRLVRDKLINGCGGPFMYDTNEKKAVKCDYI